MAVRLAAIRSMR